MAENSSETNQLLRRAADGDTECWGALLLRHQERLRRMVALRLDHRLQSRIDPGDVLQEVYVQALGALHDYLRHPTIPFFVWLRGITGNQLLSLHRFHLGTAMRAAGRELSLDQFRLPEANSAALAAQLLGHDSRPSEAAVRAEMKARIQQALERLDPLDREVLALRHFEQLTSAESAQALGIKPAAAGKRYLRALERLKDALQDMPGGLKELLP